MGLNDTGGSGESLHSGHHPAGEEVGRYIGRQSGFRTDTTRVRFRSSFPVGSAWARARAWAVGVWER